MGLNDNLRNTICQAAMLHDIGKIGIPDSIVLKPKRLTSKEWDVIKLHPISGAELAEMGGCNQEVVRAILCHHERWDGQGYPLGLSGGNIPLSARILAIADAYDAMTTDRPYRKSLSHQKAVAELEDGAGSQFDPYLIEVFIKDVVGSRLSG